MLGGTRRFNDEVKPVYELSAGLSTVIALISTLTLVVWPHLPFADTQEGGGGDVETRGTMPATSLSAPSTEGYPSTSVEARGFGVQGEAVVCVPAGWLISALAVAPDGMVAAGTERGILSVTSADCASPQDRQDRQLSGTITAVEFAPSGDMIYVATSELEDGQRVGYISAYATRNLEQQPVFRSSPVSGTITSLEFASDGETIYSSGDGVRRWRPELGLAEPQPVQGIDDPHLIDISLTQLSGGEDALFALGALGSLYRVELTSWTARSINVCGPHAYSLAATSEHVFVVGRVCVRAVDHEGNVADVLNFSQVAFPEGFIPRSIDAVDGAHETVVVGGGGDPGTGQMYMWDPSTGAGTDINPGARDAVRTVALRPDGRAVAADIDDAVNVWALDNN